MSLTIADAGVAHDFGTRQELFDTKLAPGTEKLPIDPSTYQTARDFNLDPTTCALNGGEDYEMLFTIAQADYDKVKGNPSITVIAISRTRPAVTGWLTNKEASMNSPHRGGMPS